MRKIWWLSYLCIGLGAGYLGLLFGVFISLLVGIIIGISIFSGGIFITLFLMGHFNKKEIKSLG